MPVPAVLWAIVLAIAWVSSRIIWGFAVSLVKKGEPRVGAVALCGIGSPALFTALLWAAFLFMPEPARRQGEGWLAFISLAIMVSIPLSVGMAGLGAIMLPFGDGKKRGWQELKPKGVTQSKRTMQITLAMVILAAAYLFLFR